MHDPLLKGNLVVLQERGGAFFTAGFVTQDAEEGQDYAHIRPFSPVYGTRWYFEYVEHAVWSFVGPVHRRP